MLRFIVFSIFLIYNTCALENGDLAVIGQFPAHVAIVVDTSYCAGAIVNENHVVTVTSCLQNQQNMLVPVNRIFVVAGIIDVDLSSKRLPISAIFPHPQFNPLTLENDLAVIRLSEHFIFNPENPTPAIDQTTINDRIVADQTNCMVAGWNSTNHIGSLYYLTVPILNRNIPCNEQHRGKIRDTMICAGNLEPTSGRLCTTNRGSGLYCNNQLTGILSFGFSCNETIVQPAVYTQVRMYREWIIAQFSQTSTPTTMPTPNPTGTVTMPIPTTTTPGKASTAAVPSIVLLTIIALLLRA